MHYGATHSARYIVENYTLFKKSLLKPSDLEKLIEQAWDKTQKTECRYLEIVPEVLNYVCQQQPAM